MMKTASLPNARVSACFFIVVLGTILMAMEAEAADSAVGLTTREILKAGGPLMYVLGALSVIGLALVIYLAVSLRISTVVPKNLLDDLLSAIESRRLEEARMICRKNPSALAAVADAALACLERAPDTTADTLKEIVESEGSRQASHIQSRIQYLLDVAVIAPMVGLLGTVMGMLQAFNAVALDIAKARPMVLAKGVSQALITTAAGLIVGIPAMVGHAWFRGRSADLISRLEAAAAELVLRLPKRSGYR